ncbi:ABC transporter substrate-binding protein [Actinacidiphila epipremni]|jgi:multiple sugar transport system substrate-binding protein|uniref:Extracellular solute-binding protein n=1 Tax=Actinacidiphila epipremni TaxID=2053013 RepID=A0ABX0ZXN9_9ACTN|nr:extracellular solute-binding protein [Actinacidiphila epipremni]NJP47049.1 extracellular solute-binding protein [Actinacidiphila epipremni]
MDHRTRPWAARVVAASVVSALALALGGCGTGGDQASGSTGKSNSIDVVTRWSAGNSAAAAQARVFKAFTDETGVKVNATDGLETIDDQVENAVAAGKSPDVVIVNLYDKTLGWLDAGVTVPVDNYIKQWGLADKLKPAAVDEWRVGGKPDGQVQGFPYSGFGWPVWYNTDLLKKAGVDTIPTTTDQLIDAAKKLRAKGIQPLTVGGNDWTGQKLFYQIAESYTDAATMQNVMKNGGYCADPNVMKGIQLFTQLRDAGVFADNAAGLNADAMYAAYYSGKAAIMSAGSWAYTEAKGSGTGIETHTTLAGLPIPAGSTFTKPTAFQGFTGVGFMITKRGASKDRIDNVRKFITKFYDQATVGDFVKDASILPPTTGDFGTYATDPLLSQSLKLDPSVDYATVPDVWIGSASDPIIQVLTGAYGKSSPDKICKGLDDATKG